MFDYTHTGISEICLKVVPKCNKLRIADVIDTWRDSAHHNIHIREGSDGSTCKIKNAKCRFRASFHAG